MSVGATWCAGMSVGAAGGDTVVGKAAEERGVVITEAVVEVGLPVYSITQSKPVSYVKYA